MKMTEAPPIDASVPRVCIHQAFEGEPGPCPRCHGALHQQHQLYAVATRRGSRMTDTFMISSDFGWFCEDCPTVVINPASVGEMLSFSRPDWDSGDAFALLGLVDLDAVPEDKSHLPLGDDDNPIPLVEFTAVSGSPGARQARRRRSKRSRPKRSKPKRRKKKRRR
jgi:hypothetical protein